MMGTKENRKKEGSANYIGPLPVFALLTWCTVFPVFGPRGHQYRKCRAFDYPMGHTYCCKNSSVYRTLFWFSILSML